MELLRSALVSISFRGATEAIELSDGPDSTRSAEDALWMSFFRHSLKLRNIPDAFAAIEALKKDNFRASALEELGMCVR